MDILQKGGIKNVDVSDDDKKDTVQDYIPKNYLGEPVDIIPKLASTVPGWVDETGYPHPCYQSPNKDVDGNGFDLHFPIINNCHIPKGTILARLGNDYGRFLSIPGTKFEALAIGYDWRSIPYNEFEVISDEFYCTVGIVAPQPQFGKQGKGHGIQCMADQPISFLLRHKILQRI